MITCNCLHDEVVSMKRIPLARNAAFSPFLFSLHKGGADTARIMRALFPKNYRQSDQTST